MRIYLDNSQNPYPEKRISIEKYLKNNSSIHIGRSLFDSYVKPLSGCIMAAGIKPKDSYHVASAIVAKCDYFLTTDKRLLKYKSDKIQIMNPIDFIREMEGENIV